MRIVGGSHRGRALLAPAGPETRPTGDRARQALFNILEHGRLAAAGSPLRGAHVLDVFAGTGALGLEALSRGAARASFFERAPAALGILRSNIKALREESRSAVIAGDATRPPAAAIPASLAFLDPPYGTGAGPVALAALIAAGWLAAGAVAVLEVAAREAVALPESVAIVDERCYGAARFVLVSTLS